MNSVGAKRWVLFLTCLMTFGLNYSYDNTGALKSQLRQHFHRIPKTEYEFLFNLTYSLYSVPNMVLPLFGGLLVDRVGVRIMSILLTSIVFLGQVIVSLGSATENFILILVGRILFGLGGETLSVTQTKFLVKWFDASELAFVFGISNSVSSLGSVLNFKWSPWFATQYNVTTAFWVGAIICSVSFLCSLLLVRIDREFIGISKDTSSDRISVRDIRRFSLPFWLLTTINLVSACIGAFSNSAVSVFLERDFFQSPPEQCQRCGVGEYKLYCESISSNCPPSPPFAWPLPQLNINCTIHTAFDQYHCSKDPPYIQDDGINCDDKAWRNGVFTNRYCETKNAASEVAAGAVGISPLIQTFFSPLGGYLVDVFGRRPLWIVAAQVMFALTHTFIGGSRMPVVIPLILLGASWCLQIGSCNTSVPFVVQERAIGTAFGLFATFANIGAAIIPLIVASLVSKYGHYLPQVQNLFIGLCYFNILLSISLLAIVGATGFDSNRWQAMDDATMKETPLLTTDDEETD